MIGSFGTANNYIVAIDSRGVAAGLATLDVTTGELILETVPASDAAAAVARYEPRELVLPAEVSVPADVGTVTVREAWEFDPELAREDLMRTYGIASLDGLGVSAEDRPAIGRRGRAAALCPRAQAGWAPAPRASDHRARGDVLPLDEMTRRNPRARRAAPRRRQKAPTLLEGIDRTPDADGGPAASPLAPRAAR